MELSVLNNKGKETGRKVKLDPLVFGINPNDHAIYLDVKQYLANKRQGTHKSKERAEIVGSTRKIKKQKGTGTARAGSIKAKEKSILIVEDFQMEAPKTASYNKVLQALGLKDKKSLVVLGEPNKNVYLSSRNLEQSIVVNNSELNTYQITNASSLVIFESAITQIETILNKV